jgi:hypothetical protein
MGLLIPLYLISLSLEYEPHIPVPAQLYRITLCVCMLLYLNEAVNVYDVLICVAYMRVGNPLLRLGRRKCNF